MAVEQAPSMANNYVPALACMQQPGQDAGWFICDTTTDTIVIL